MEIASVTRAIGTGALSGVGPYTVVVLFELAAVMELRGMSDASAHA